MKKHFYNNPAIIFFILILVIVSLTVVSFKQKKEITLSPALKPKCIFNGVEIRSESCNGEDALLQKPCFSSDNNQVGKCIYRQ